MKDMLRDLFQEIDFPDWGDGWASLRLTEWAVQRSHKQ